MKCYKKRVRARQRYDLALEQLTSDTDFFSFLKLLRITDLMSKVYLKEYQRQLIPYFKKYQLTEIDGDRKKKVFDAARLGSTAQSLIEG